MPPSTSLSTPLLRWRCPQCAIRTFSTSRPSRKVGPEHPLYIDVPEPPQPDKPYRPFIKGRLPVPRNVFAGAKGKDRADDEEIAKATPLPERVRNHRPGSREEWKVKMSEARRRNLSEGLKGLRARRTATEYRAKTERERQRVERQELRSRSEREDERLTAPSHGLDLEKLMRGPLPDPNRSLRLARKAENVSKQDSRKHAERMGHLHTLYMNARSFIVTPQQLDVALDEEFGTADQPASFNGVHNASMWAKGKPATVQDMLNQGNKVGTGRAVKQTHMEVNQKRVQRIAEHLTGGKMDKEIEFSS